MKKSIDVRVYRTEQQIIIMLHTNAYYTCLRATTGINAVAVQQTSAKNSMDFLHRSLRRALRPLYILLFFIDIARSVCIKFIIVIFIQINTHAHTCDIVYTNMFHYAYYVCV